MTVVNNAQSLVEQLHELQQGGYIFRGHEDFNYSLIPKAFRSDWRAQMKREFGVDDSIIRDWFNNRIISKQVASLLLKYNVTHHEQQIIQKLLNYCLYLMHYNHSLNLFAQKNPHRISEKDRATILVRDAAHWKAERTFYDLFSSYFPRLIERHDMSGNLLHGANPFEDLASLDETLPQHYDTPTAALDWTFNYNVAIRFALGFKKINSRFLTLSALKVIDPDRAPLRIMEKSIYVDNKRAKCQDGTFSYFTRPCSFYLQHGDFPWIDHYDQQQKNGFELHTFELKVFTIERNGNVMNDLKNIVEAKGITYEFLYPDERSEKECA